VKQFHDKIVSDDKNMIIYPVGSLVLFLPSFPYAFCQQDGFHELVHEPAHREKLINDEIAFIEARLSKGTAAPAEAKL
jgi:hypothetical protein